MRVEVIIWLVTNFISLVVSGKDLYETYRVWYWSRSIDVTKQMARVTKRNVRASLFKFLLALFFMLAGVVAVTLDTVSPVWFLITGSVILTLDVVLESKYRSYLFQTSEEKQLYEELKEDARWTYPRNEDS